MSDLEAIALSLTSEFMFIESENLFFNQLQNEQISNLIDWSQYNKIRNKLFLFP
jgi:hypothetical protein